MIVWIILAFVLFFFLRKFFKRFRIYEQSVTMYSGTIGSGKTYLGVDKALTAYRKQAKQYRKGKGGKKRLYRFFHPDCIYPPSLYSTIPIKLGKNKWSKPLKKEHLTMQEPLPQKCVIFIDEIGAFASQWDFDNPWVQERLQFFMRYFRQFLDGKMILTDQSVSRVCKPIRELIGRVYWLHDFHRKWRILPLYEVFVLPMLMVEDSCTRLDDDEDNPDTARKLIGWLPYKWLRFCRRYDSRCYAPLYTKPAVSVLDDFDGFQTDYLIDLQVPASVKRDYKECKDVYRKWIYEPRFLSGTFESRMATVTSVAGRKR